MFATTGTLTLIGSGEMTPGMARAHRRVMERIAGTVQPVFLDTPAGFELNSNAISQKAVDYFAAEFQLPLAVASYPSASAATPQSIEAALQRLRRANYIFAGPGSPTYAVRNWRHSPIFETVAAKLAAGAHVAFASAAVLSLGRFTLPVYEIYKVGEEPYWLDGLDLLGRLGLDASLLPHWNNNSGAGHDTTHCFIGAARFAQLQSYLPHGHRVLGIDEYTACTLDFANEVVEVFGAGSATVLGPDGAQAFASGQKFPLALLKRPATATTDDHHADVFADFRTALEQDRYPARALGFLHGFMEHARRAHNDLKDPAERARHQSHSELLIREMIAMLAVWLEAQPGQQPAAMDTREAIAPYVTLLAETRQKLRAAKQFALADELRNALGDLGVSIEDTATGPVVSFARG